MAVVVREDRGSVDERLAELGLSIDGIKTAFLRADLDRRECTEFDPIALPGMIFWGRTVRYLRERYVVEGWHRADPNQVPLLVSPERTFALVPSSGSSGTGIAAINPSTRYAKGAAVIERVQLNEQLMIEGFEPVEEEARPVGTMPTWLLLYRHSKRESDKKVRLDAELSLPTGANDGRRVDTWYERIILPSIEFEPLAIVDDETTPLDEIDIPISRLG